jgi:hypothetical protein
VNLPPAVRARGSGLLLIFLCFELRISLVRLELLFVVLPFVFDIDPAGDREARRIGSEPITRNMNCQERVTPKKP